MTDEVLLIQPRPGRSSWPRLPVLLLALTFVTIQFGLAMIRLDTQKRFALVAVILLGTLIIAAWYAIFLLRAGVVVSERDVVVRNWLGRVRLHADRQRVKFDLVSVRDVGLSEQFGIISIDQSARAAPIRRAAWGDRALLELSNALHTRHSTQLKFRSVSKSELAHEFPRVHVQNFPAIAIIVAIILLMAFVINWRT